MKNEDASLEFYILLREFGIEEKYKEYVREHKDNFNEFLNETDPRLWVVCGFIWPIEEQNFWYGIYRVWDNICNERSF